MEKPAENSCLGLAYLAPLIGAYTIPVTLALTYYWSAFVTQNVDPILPTVSRTYADPPQAVWFGQLFALVSLLLTFTLYLRYHQVNAVLNDKENSPLVTNGKNTQDRTQLVNKLTLYFGIMFSFFSTLLTSTRITEIYDYHTVLVIIVFFSAPVLSIAHTYLSFRLKPKFTSTATAITRLVISVVIVLSLVIYFLGIYWSKSANTTVSCRKFYKTIAAAAEYLFVLMLCPFLLTFVSELKRLQVVNGPQFRFDNYLAK